MSKLAFIKPLDQITKADTSVELTEEIYNVLSFERKVLLALLTLVKAEQMPRVMSNEANGRKFHYFVGLAESIASIKGK